MPEIYGGFPHGHGTDESGDLDPVVIEQILEQVQQVDHGLPAGGSTGEVLTKSSDTNYAVEWSAPAADDDVLAACADVDIYNPQDGQVLAYNADASVWENAAPPSDDDSLAACADVQVYNPQDGDVLVYKAEAAAWENAPPPYAGAPIVRQFPFAYNTPNLLQGAALYTPTIGDVLVSARIVATEAWDGTTPQWDVGQLLVAGDFPGYGWIKKPSTQNVRFDTADPVKVFVNSLGYLAYAHAAGTAPALPLTVEAGVNDEFQFGPVGSELTYIVAPDTYTTLDALAAAMSAALSGASPLSDVLYIQVGDTAFTAWSKAWGETHNGDEFLSGTNDVLAALGFTNEQALADAANADPGSTTGAAVLYLITATPI